MAFGPARMMRLLGKDKVDIVVKLESETYHDLLLLLPP